MGPVPPDTASDSEDDAMVMDEEDDEQGQPDDAERRPKYTEDEIRAYHEAVLKSVLDNVVITNVVATFILDVKDIQLKQLALNCNWAHHSQPTFAALITRIHTPRATCLLYERGVVVCMGTQSEDQALLACSKFVLQLNKEGIACNIIGMRVFNYVASIYVFPVDLDFMSENFSYMVDYKKQRFPGATIRCANLNTKVPTRVTVEVFEKGKGNVTGALSREEIDDVVKDVYWEVIVPSRVDDDKWVIPDAPVLDNMDYDFDPEDLADRAVNMGISGKSGTKSGGAGPAVDYDKLEKIDLDDINNIEDLLAVLRSDDDNERKGYVTGANLAEIDKRISEAGGYGSE